MSEDIVAQLRLWSDNAKEQDATDVVVGLLAAADEIERLRKENTDLRWRLCKVLVDSRDCDADDIAKEKGWDDLVG